MALTKTEAYKLSNDMMLAGVIETVVRWSPVLKLLPFTQVVGTNITYNREATMPSAAFNTPNGSWTEATPTFSQQTTQLAILGGDADVDNFLNDTYSNVNNIAEQVIALRAKSVALAFSDSFFNGDTNTNPLSFDGIHKLIPVAQTITAGANGAALELGMVDELIDRVLMGPDILLMSRRTRRQLRARMRDAGLELATAVDEEGETFETYNGIRIAVDDFIKNDRTLGSGTNISTMYAVKFGEDTGVIGLEYGDIQVVNVGPLETKDVNRYRIKWYCGMTVTNPVGTAKLEGLTA